MNITSVNLAPKSAGTKAIEGEGFSASEQSGATEDFASALKGQEKLLQEPKNKDEAPAATQQNSEPQATSEKAKPITSDVNHKDLVALLEEYFPLQNTKTEVDVTTPDASVVLALSEDLNRRAEQEKPADNPETIQQDMGALLPMTGIMVSKPAPEEAKTHFSTGNGNGDNDKNHNPAVSLQKFSVSGQLTPMSPGDNNQKATAVDNTDNFKQALATVMNPEGSVNDVKAELLTAQKPVEARVESLVIAKPMAHPGWSKDLGEHIVWLNNKAISAAEIKLNPVHLGPISIRIDVNQDNQTTIQFTAQHAETKEAIEASMPKLREMLQGQQLNLVNVNISQNPGSHHGRPFAQPFQGASGNQDQDFEKLPQTVEPGESEPLISKGLLSLYA